MSYGPPNYSCAFLVEVDGMRFEGCCRDGAAQGIDEAFTLQCPTCDQDLAVAFSWSADRPDVNAAPSLLAALQS